MSEPIEITDELRHAVLLELCDTQGHIFDFSNVVNVVNIDTDSGETIFRQQVKAQDDVLLPHLFCSRCGKTWLIIEESGDSYDDAEMKLRGRMYKADPLNSRPDRSSSRKR